MFGPSNSRTNAGSLVIGDRTTIVADGADARMRVSSPAARSMLPALVPCGTDTNTDCGFTSRGRGDDVRELVRQRHETVFLVGEPVDAAAAAADAEARAGGHRVVRHGLMAVGD